MLFFLFTESCFFFRIIFLFKAYQASKQDNGANQIICLIFTLSMVGFFFFSFRHIKLYSRLVGSIFNQTINSLEAIMATKELMETYEKTQGYHMEQWNAAYLGKYIFSRQFIPSTIFLRLCY